MEEKVEEKLVSTGDPQNATESDQANSVMAKESSATVDSSLSLTSPEVSPTQVVENYDQPAAAPSVRVEGFIVPVSRPIQEQSAGEMNNTMFSMNAGNLNAQWQMLRNLQEECEQLSVKLTGFVTRLNRVNESHLPTALPSTADYDKAAAQTTAKENENVEMQNAAIKEAVKTFQKFHACFNEMDDKMKQWVPAIDVAKASEGERLLIQQQAEKIEQELRTQLDAKKAECEQLQKSYEEQLKKKDGDLAKLQENLTWKTDAEEHKKLLNKYKQEAEEHKQEAEQYKQKLEHSEKIAQRLEQETKDYQDTIEQKNTLIQQLEETKATNERTITKQNELIKTKGDEVEVLKNQNNLIIAEVKKSEVDAKQRELEHDKQKLQQELNQKKEESQKQMQHSSENAKVQSEIKELHGESKYWKGRYEGLHELVSTISDMGKTAMTKLPNVSTTFTTRSPDSITQQEEAPSSIE